MTGDDTTASASVSPARSNGGGNVRSHVRSVPTEAASSCMSASSTRRSTGRTAIGRKAEDLAAYLAGRERATEARFDELVPPIRTWRPTSASGLVLSCLPAAPRHDL